MLYCVLFGLVGFRVVSEVFLSWLGWGWEFRLGFWNFGVLGGE